MQFHGIDLFGLGFRKVNYLKAENLDESFALIGTKMAFANLYLTAELCFDELFVYVDSSRLIEDAVECDWTIGFGVSNSPQMTYKAKGFSMVSVPEDRALARFSFEVDPFN